MAVAFIGEWRLLIFLLPSAAYNRYLRNFICLPRATVCADRICSFWGSAGLPKKEPWIEWYLLQRPGYQTTNKSDLTAADEVCLANRWWNVLFVIDTSEWWNYSLNDVPIEEGLICRSLYFAFHWTVDSLPRMSSHANWVTLKSLVYLKGVFQRKRFLFV